MHQINLNHSHFDGLEGIYIIWHGQPDPHVVYVGQGVIRGRLSTHRQDPSILAFRDRGLFVTWAKVDSGVMDGVERYLAEQWKPKVGGHFPNVTPIAVNSPWEK